MKKLITLALIGFYFGAQAQLPVSQTPEKKKVILEEYTGKTCVYCPDGHKIASAMKAADPDNVFLINIHTGSFASGTPNYKTPFGLSLAGQTGLTGYPSGTVNRHVFSGSTTAHSRTVWPSSAATIKTQDAYVNVALDASVDLMTKVLTVNVEAYYTAGAPNASNFLNVAITQDDIHGPQSGGATFNPDMIDEDGLYIHNHMLRHLITGQWGEEITTVSMGTLVQKTYTYTLPDTIGDVYMDTTKLHVVAFMTETHQEIINGNGVSPTLTGLTANLEAQVLSLEAPVSSCAASFDPKIEILNWGNTPITSMKIEYSANNLPVNTYDWTGNLLSGLTEDIDLPTLMYNSQASSDILVKVVEVNGGNDDNLTNNEVSATVLEAPEYETTTMELAFSSDAYGSEISWNLYDAAGTVIQTSPTYGNNQAITETLTLTTNDCYTFEFLDSYGDGISGAFNLTFGSTNVLTGSGSFKKISKGFATVDASGNGNGNPTDQVDTTDPGNPDAIIDLDVVSEFNVFPNPATEFVQINLETKTIASVIVNLVDVLGRTVANVTLVDGVAKFNTSKLNAGIYIVNAISNEKSIATSRVVIR